MAARRFLCFFAATLALAQAQMPANKRPIHIDGTVLEKETRAPIPNAKVTLAATENSDQQVTTSDANGRFSFNTIEPFEMGLPLQLRAESPGYLPALPDVGGNSIAQWMQSDGQGPLLITRDKSNYATELNLSRAATLRGTLIDQDTKKPLAKLAVSPQRRLYRGGEISFAPGGGPPVITGADGSFHFDGLPAGDYFLQVQDPLKPIIEAIPPVTPPAALPAPPEGALGYGRVILPGATADYPEFASITVRAGTAVDLGQLPLRQQRLRNFTGTVDSECRDSERVTIYFGGDRSRAIVMTDGPSQKIPCGPFRIMNVPDGAFAVAAWVLGGNGGYVSQPLPLRASDPIHLRVQPRGTANGVLEVEDTPSDQFPKDLEGLYVGFNPKTMPYLQGDTMNPPSVNGKFQGVVYGGTGYEILFSRLPEAYYVKRLFYNGVEQPDPMRFTSTPGVLDHNVRIVLSPHPATFQAQVDPGNTVVLMRDTERIVLTAGPQQRGVIKRGLRPGSYRAFAIPTASLSSLELPGTIDRYLINAQTVKLEEGQATTASFVSQ